MPCSAHGLSLGHQRPIKLNRRTQTNSQKYPARLSRVSNLRVQPLRLHPGDKPRSRRRVSQVCRQRLVRDLLHVWNGTLQRILTNYRREHSLLVSGPLYYVSDSFFSLQLLLDLLTLLADAKRHRACSESSLHWVHHPGPLRTQMARVRLSIR